MAGKVARRRGCVKSTATPLDAVTSSPRRCRGGVRGADLGLRPYSAGGLHSEPYEAWAWSTHHSTGRDRAPGGLALVELPSPRANGLARSALAGLEPRRVAGERGIARLGQNGKGRCEHLPYLALVNRLQEALHEYYPTALQAFDDWTSPAAWAFIVAFPTPQELARAGKRKWDKFLHTHKLYRPRTADKRLNLFAHAGDFVSPNPAVTAAKSFLAVVLAKQLRLLAFPCPFSCLFLPGIPPGGHYQSGASGTSDGGPGSAQKAHLHLHTMKNV